MLDIKFIRENTNLVKEAAKNKHVKVNIDKLLELDQKKRDLQARIETLRKDRNELSQFKTKPTKEDLVKVKDKSEKIKNMLKDLEPQLTEISEELLEIMYHVPNIPAKDVLVGASDKENKIIKTYGKPKKFDFKAKDHMELGESLNLIDTVRGAKISGSRFAYLKNQAVQLEFAIAQYLIAKLSRHGFQPIIPPVLEKFEIAKGTGYFEALNDDAYHTREDELVLVGTSEQSIVPYFANEIIDVKIPKRFLGFSTCFRREAGSYGKDVTGILRMHQFDKLEMVSFCGPVDSEKEHDLILQIEEEIMQDLELSYQVSKMCTGDLGMPAARKYDIEVWIPTQNTYRELTSCSTCTDFQARRLNIRHKNKDGKVEFVHILNGTGSAIGRTLIAIFENHQQKDGSIKIPFALQPYCGFKEIKINK